MAGFGGATLKLTQTLLYAMTFCCSALILAVYSYFLAVQSIHDANIPSWQRAVEGVSGIGVLYSALAVLLTCCLGGKPFFAFIGIFFDICLTAGFLAIAVLTRDGAGSCNGVVKSPLGTGPENEHPSTGSGAKRNGYSVSYGSACQLNKAAFAVSIIGAALFLISAILQLFLGRHHQREKRWGPSPQNNYTSGSGTRWFKRRGKNDSVRYSQNDPVVSSAMATGANNRAGRTSLETGYTGSTAVVDSTGGTYLGSKYEPQQPSRSYHSPGSPPMGQAAGYGIPTAGGYHTGPTGSAVNPYGYDSGRTGY